MYESSNHNLMPMRGTIERETRHTAKKAERIRAVLHGLTYTVTAPPFPAMSSHYQAPEPQSEQLTLRYTQPAEGVGYTDRPDAF